MSADVVSGDSALGGLVGINGGEISYTYASGSVDSAEWVGGLVGSNDDGVIYDSFWDIDTSGKSNMCGYEGDEGSGCENANGKTTAEMQMGSTFTDAGWDFVGETANGTDDVWVIRNGLDYPKLVWTGYYGGHGTQENPYEIWTAAQMHEIGANPNDWDAHFVLAADINLADYTGTQFNMIGMYPENPFAGVFDGNGHSIMNFTYSSTDISRIGLFRYVDDGEIKDVNLVDPNIDVGGLNVGSLVGLLKSGIITECCVRGGSVVGSSGEVGGLVGVNGGVISNCYATAEVSGYYAVGGLVGESHMDGTISDCYFTGSLTGREEMGGLVGINGGGFITNCYAIGCIRGWEVSTYIGGLVGGNDHRGEINSCYASSLIEIGDDSWCIGGLAGRNVNNGDIRNCYATVSINSAELCGAIGGLVGENNGSIWDSYATGSVSGDMEIGGITGYNQDATIYNCYAACIVDGNENIGGLVGYDYQNSGTYTSCFWDSNVNPDVNGIGNGSDPNVIGKTTAEMQTKNTYTDAGWDFLEETANGTDDVWRLCEDDVNYPKLSWQFALGDFNCPDGVDVNDLLVLCEQWLLQELSLDVWPEGGDGVVDFSDWASFAGGWKSTNDIDELADFAYQWLKTGANYYIADIAPARQGDGIVNMPDFAALAKNWLEGI
ncbi:MAG: GLUG motif-containing protein [Planctomycetota bacterium]|jgi:hypothetical protein